MTIKVRKLARGLLGFLESKQAGQNPTDLSDLILPTLDMQPFLSEANADVIGQTVINIAAAGLYIMPANVIPNGKVALLHGFFFGNTAAPLGAGVTLRGFPVITRRKGGVDIPMPCGTISVFSPNNYPVFGATFPDPVLLRPYDNFGVFMYDVVVPIVPQLDRDGFYQLFDL